MTVGEYMRKNCPERCELCPESHEEETEGSDPELEDTADAIANGPSTADINAAVGETAPDPEPEDTAFETANALGMEFVELSKVNGSGFPATFEMGSNELLIYPDEFYEEYLKAYPEFFEVGNWNVSTTIQNYATLEALLAPDWRPLHSVTLTRPFSVQTTEVTQGQWVEVMGSLNLAYQSSSMSCNRSDCASHPIGYVSWNEAQNFISKLNSQRGLDCGDTSTEEGFLKASETPGCYRLPTEAEWEYFTRAGTSTPFNIGEKLDYDKVNCNGEHPHKNDPGGKSRNETVAVGSLGNANPWGLSDTHGNIAEWVQDWWQRDYYREVSSNRDPTGPSHGPGRVVRGGDYYYNSSYCLSFYRSFRKPISTDRHLGLRLVKTTRE